jgi:phosphonate transport system ATP-binding protein
MALITRLAAEEQIPALVNIHDVALARRFAQRILGLNEGVFVFEGAPGDLTREALDLIYRGAGEELTSALGA